MLDLTSSDVLNVFWTNMFKSCVIFWRSCVDRKSSDLGFSGTTREYLQTDCAINVVCEMSSSPHIT